MDFGSLKIGDVFPYEGKFYKVVPDNMDVGPCVCCAFSNTPCHLFQCKADERTDGQSVEFAECTENGTLLNEPFNMTDLQKELMNDIEFKYEASNSIKKNIPPELLIKIIQVMERYACLCASSSLIKAAQNSNVRAITHDKNIVLL